MTKASAAELMTRFLQGQQMWILKYDPQFLSAKKKRKLQAEERACDDSEEYDGDDTWRDLLMKTAATSSLREESLGRVREQASKFDSLQQSVQPTLHVQGTLWPELS